MPERSILAWLAIGLVVGVVGKFVMPGRYPGSMIVSILIGIGGALLGGLVAETMQWTPSGAWQNFVASFFGAAAVLALCRLVRHRQV
ncbi:MAG: GlsB/YeaQ/YmgE family stress response membrane protein [Sphingomonas sp.]